DAYLQEHALMIRGDILSMAFDVTRAKPMYDQDRPRFQQFFSAQARVRGLSSAQILDSAAKVVERADIKTDPPISVPDSEGLATVNENEPQIGMLLSTN